MKRIDIDHIFGLFTGIACLMLVPPAMGESRQHGVHVHGVAEMTLVLDQRDLEIEFSGPAMSVVGFEHTAQTTTDIEAVKKAQTALNNGANVFTFIGTQCVMRDVTVDVSAVWDGMAVDRGEGAGQGSHARSHESHEEHEKHEESHSDISAHYTFRCMQDDSPLAVRVGVDDLPFDVEEIRAKWVTDSGQGAAQLSADKWQLTLR
jgi:hypothetical protein